jgi:hypothetical protein
MTPRTASSRGGSGGGGPGRIAPPATGPVRDLDSLRIARALLHRARYKYVQPRIEREAEGWKIVCANCSRNIHPDGGEIPIAWFAPAGPGRWALHARDHAQGAWVQQASGLTLAQALDIVCADTTRLYWP